MKQPLVKNLPYQAKGFLGYFKPFLVLMAIIITSFPAQAAEKKLMVFGDSLVAGYNIPVNVAFPAQLEKKLQEKGHDIRVINAGVSGDTTSGGLSRLEWMLSDKPDYVILELGANDMLRAIDPKVAEDNLRAMLEILKQRNIPVLLAGMKAFKNLGPEYGEAYDRMYKALAGEYGAVYYPFFLEGIAMKPEFNLDDGLHPNEKGVAVIVDNIFPKVEELIGK